MPWSSKMTNYFADMERGPNIQRLPWGPYNLLLNTLFPADGKFMVSPNMDHTRILDSADFTISLIKVGSPRLPMLVLLAGPSQDLLFNSRREAADRQMRQHLLDLSGCAPLPVLYGISTMGTKLCFYEFEKATGCMMPQCIPSDPESTMDTAPQEQWDCDVFDAVGEQRLRALVTQIMDACEHI